MPHRLLFPMEMAEPSTSSTMKPPTREGLEWEDTLFGPEPRWAREPQLAAIANVCASALALGPHDRCDVSFFAKGCFNKLYLIETAEGKSLMRISLPVDPGHKTRGEVTTMRWIRRTTQVPVPRVIAFDDSQDNEIGFEWILMELMPGETAYRRWRKLSMSDKTRVVEQIAEFQSQLLLHSLEHAKFQSIGTLCGTADVLDPAPDPKPDRLVSGAFFAGDRFHYDVPRGPFQSSHDYLSAYLSVIRQQHSGTLNDEKADEDSKQDAKTTLHLATRLTALLPTIFPPSPSPSPQPPPPEPTALWHADLSLSNILLSSNATITSILDWECASCKPLWEATGMPQFLQGPAREAEPQRDGYGDENDTDVDADLDNEGKNGLYWRHLMEYEQTRLRGVYKARMRELWPPWEKERAGRSLKADFLGAVEQCNAGWHWRRLGWWIDAVEAGRYPRLMDVLDMNKG